ARSSPRLDEADRPILLRPRGLAPLRENPIPALRPHGRPAGQRIRRPASLSRPRSPEVAALETSRPSALPHLRPAELRPALAAPNRARSAPAFDSPARAAPDRARIAPQGVRSRDRNQQPDAPSHPATWIVLRGAAQREARL